MKSTLFAIAVVTVTVRATDNTPDYACASEFALGQIGTATPAGIYRFGGCDSSDTSDPSFDSLNNVYQLDIASMKWTEAEGKTLKFNGNTVSAQPYMLDNYQSIDVHVASTASPADFYQINLHQEIWYNYPSPAASITAMEAVVSTTTEYSPFIIYGANDNTTSMYSFNITDNHHTVVEGYSAENRVSCLASTTDQKKLYSLSGFDNDEIGETEWDIWSASDFSESSLLDTLVTGIADPLPFEMKYSTECMVSIDGYLYVFHGDSYWFLNTNDGEGGDGDKIAWYKGATTLDPVHGKDGHWMYSAVMVEDVIYVSSNGLTTVIDVTRGAA